MSTVRRSPEALCGSAPSRDALVREQAHLHDPPDVAKVHPAILVKECRLAATDPAELNVLWLFQPWPAEIALDFDEEVELAMWLRPLGTGRIPVLDVDEHRVTAKEPAGLFLYLAAQRGHQVLTRFDVASHHIPAVRQEPPTGSTAMDEDTAIAVADERTDRADLAFASRRLLKRDEVGHVAGHYRVPPDASGPEPAPATRSQSSVISASANAAAELRSFTSPARTRLFTSSRGSRKNSRSSRSPCSTA